MVRAEAGVRMMMRARTRGSMLVTWSCVRAACGPDTPTRLPNVLLSFAPGASVPPSNHSELVACSPLCALVRSCAHFCKLYARSILTASEAGLKQRKVPFSETSRPSSPHAPANLKKQLHQSSAGQRPQSPEQGPVSSSCSPKGSCGMERPLQRRLCTSRVQQGGQAHKSTQMSRLQVVWRPVLQPPRLLQGGPPTAGQALHFQGPPEGRAASGTEPAWEVYGRCLSLR